MYVCMYVVSVTLFTDTPAPSVYYTGSPIGIGSSSTDPSSGSTAYPLRPLPESFSLGEPVVADLSPGLSYTYFTLQHDSYVQFNLSVGPQAKLAVYGRLTLPPSPTQHDFSHLVLADKLHAIPRKQKRATTTYYGFPEQVRQL